MVHISQWTSDNIISDFGILTGCDSAFEWMLPWWYENYRRHNDHQVLFANFGMSRRRLDWCSSRGHIVEIGEHHFRKTWFKKPLAIINSPVNNVVWVDLDCEIRGDLLPFRKYCTEGVGLTLDPHTRWCKDKNDKLIANPLASGVVATHFNNDLMRRWADECIDNMRCRGDQEVLNKMISIDRSGVVVMPPEYQWLRLDGENEQALIMHWTGSTGKRHIASMCGMPMPMSSLNGRINNTRHISVRKPTVTEIPRKVNSLVRHQNRLTTLSQVIRNKPKPRPKS